MSSNRSAAASAPSSSTSSISTSGKEEQLTLPPKPKNKRRRKDSESASAATATATATATAAKVTVAASHPFVDGYLLDGEIRLKGRTLQAYNCGGLVWESKRGKSVDDLLNKFETFLKERDGEYYEDNPFM